MPQPPKTTATAVLNAALALLEEEGEAGLSLRAVAARLHVTPNALYWHYADRDALLDALAAHATETLRVILRAALAARPPAHADALWPAADAYLSFARERPHLYALMTSPQRDASVSEGLWADVTALLTPLVGASRAPEVGVALWAYLHGAAGLESMHPFHSGKPHAGLHVGLRALLGALVAGET